jgi:tetratricopeptide (TPR) repeat protein
MEQGSLQAKVLDIVQRARDDERAFVSTLSDAEHYAQGSPAQWSAKDLLAHVTAWKQRITIILAAAMRGEVPPNFDDEDALNAQTFEANRDRHSSAVLADAERTAAELKAQVQALNEDMLANPDYFAWRQGRPLWQPIAANALAHSQAHLAEWYLKRGDVARATQIQERLAEVRCSLDDSPRNEGTALYNLACFYAKSGQPDTALGLLPEALRLRPDLVEWSTHDTDLDPLRQIPAFQALFQDVTAKQSKSV